MDDETKPTEEQPAEPERTGGAEAPTDAQPQAESTVEPTESVEATPDSQRPPRVVRSSERVLFGVCGGLGRYFDVDPLILRIAFAVSIFFGGLGILAYLALAIFVPSEVRIDGTRAEGDRGVGVWLLIALGALILFGTVWSVGFLATAFGYGTLVALGVVAAGIVLVALAVSGQGRWLIVPVAALALGAVCASASGLELEGGVGEKVVRPTSAAAIPADGYEQGAGRMAIDLRQIDWKRDTDLEVEARLGVGELVILAPERVCVRGGAEADLGEVVFAGQRSEGVNAGYQSREPGGRGPVLTVRARADVGAIWVANDDRTSVDDSSDRDDDAVARNVNDRACAG